ncbi:MAG: tetratricopeptide repeat protein [Phycisphaerales bacterium]|nr:tetratricopeptide repeat protein [Phycisphaerales bacterium]
MKCWALIAVVMALAGCATTRTGPYTPQSEAARNPLEAQRLTQEAVAVFDTDPEKAELLLRDALTADLFHGPAHNNLGVLYLRRGDLYGAASEFEWARKTLPGLPDPRLNLALTLERAGRIDDAIEEYRSALEVYPGHLQTLQAMTRCRLRYRPEEARDDPTVTSDLREISLRGESAEWRTWAQQRLLSLTAPTR